MSKKIKIIIFIMVLSVIVTWGITYSFKNNIKNYDTVNFIVSYDNSWKIENDDYEFRLVHKKTKSILDIQCKELDSNYIDTSLSDIIVDVVESIEEQNSDYNLINMMSSPSDMYESYSYLYEKDNDQVLVNIYKKDTKLIIAYYQADNEYFDIILDSVDTILDSLEIISGEKVN